MRPERSTRSVIRSSVRRTDVETRSGELAASISTTGRQILVDVLKLLELAEGLGLYLRQPNLQGFFHYLADVVRLLSCGLRLTHLDPQLLGEPLGGAIGSPQVPNLRVQEFWRISLLSIRAGRM
ncbi:hypothetical protein [Lentzea atacamensis]|uniref:hypothetical protein n=1 Tax=Lentzea atacamensis TaxID=531938 RepID=UPI0011B7A786|nr:hypothetical protein [Lentzea atacamensis]